MLQGSLLGTGCSWLPLQHQQEGLGREMGLWDLAAPAAPPGQPLLGLGPTRSSEPPVWETTHQQPQSATL